jgi:hypothetical protein
MKPKPPKKECPPHSPMAGVDYVTGPDGKRTAIVVYYCSKCGKKL